MNHDLDASFRTLGLSPGASWEEVKRAFRGLARSCHPDVAGPSAAGEFQKITSAYMTIRENAYSPDGIPRGTSSGGSSQGKAPPRRGLWSKMAESWDRWKSFHREREAARQNEEAREAQVREEAVAAREQHMNGLFEETERLLREIGEAVIPVSKDQGLQGELLRLQSDLPVVRALAVEALRGRAKLPEVHQALREMLTRCTEEEFLEFLHRGLPGELQKDIPELVASRGLGFSEAGGLYALRCLPRFKDRREALLVFLRHPSKALRGEALRIWPQGAPPPEGALLGELLRSDDEEILVPLLRMLRFTPLSAWVRMGVQRIAREHSSPTVRVWAKTLVSGASPMYNSGTSSEKDGLHG